MICSKVPTCKNCAMECYDAIELGVLELGEHWNEDAYQTRVRSLMAYVTFAVMTTHRRLTFNLISITTGTHPEEIYHWRDAFPTRRLYEICFDIREKKLIWRDH